MNRPSNCKICGDFCKKGKKYCSEECRKSKSNPKIIKECKQCGSKIETVQSQNKKFCDMKCFRKYEKEEKNKQKKCPQCGEKFTTPKSIDSKFCGKECMSKAFSDGRLKGSNHPNWKPKVVKRCTVCDKKFKVFPKDQQIKYCSYKCMSKDYIGKWVGEKNPNYQRITVECCYCGKEIERIPYRIKNHDNHFCNYRCEGKWLSEKNTGGNHPNWKGGHDEYYGKNWIRKRREALERDNYECQVCGRGEDEIGRKPSVHHIKPRRSFNDIESSNELDNLIVLCPKHHGKVEGWGLVPENIKR